MADTPITPASGTPAVAAPTGATPEAAPNAQGVSNPPTDQVLTNTNTDPSQGTGASPDGAPDDSQGLQPQTSSTNSTVAPKPVATAPVPPAQHPAAQRNSRLYSATMALMGGPRYKESLDPNTGTITKTQVPLSRGDIAMGIVSELLTGAMSGLSVAPGPGNIGRAAGAGATAEVGQQQQVQQQQSKATAAQGAAFEQNSRAMLNTAQAERLGVNSLKDAVTQNAPLLESYTDAGTVEGTHVSQDDLMAGMKSGKYSATDQIAIPDGFTNINGKNEQTFAIVKNPSAKVPLTQQMWDDFAAAGVPGYTKGVKIPASGSMVPGTMIASANHQMQANNQMQQDVASVEDGLNKSGDPAYQEMAKSIPDFGKLLSDPQTGPTLQSALARFQKYISHSDLHGNDLFESLRQMAAPSKPNPQNPKQSVPNGDAAFATTIAGAFGSGDPKKGWEILKSYHDAVTPQPIKNVDQAESILNDPTSTSKQKIQAQGFINTDVQVKAAAKAADKTPLDAEEQRLKIDNLILANNTAEQNAASDRVLSEFANVPAVPDANGINQPFLSALQKSDPGKAALVQAAGEGRQIPSQYALARPQGIAFAQLVDQAYPGYDWGKAETYATKLRPAFTSGKIADQLTNANTAFVHAARFLQHNNAEASVPKTNAYALLDADRIQLTEELNSAYTHAVIDQEKRAELEKGLSSSLPWVRAATAREFTSLLGDKAAQLQTQWKKGKPSQAIPDFKLFSPEGVQAYNQVMSGAPKEDQSTIDQYGNVQTGTSTGATPSSTPNPTSAYSRISADGKWGLGADGKPVAIPQQQ